MPNTESFHICHRVYQANLKDNAKAKAMPKAKAQAKAEPKAKAKVEIPLASPDGSSAQGWNPKRAAVPEAPVTQALARPRIEPCPRPAKRTRWEACLEECYHSELVCDIANKESLAAIEAMLGYAPKWQ